MDDKILLISYEEIVTYYYSSNWYQSNSGNWISNLGSLMDSSLSNVRITPKEERVESSKESRKEDHLCSLEPKHIGMNVIEEEMPIDTVKPIEAVPTSSHLVEVYIQHASMGDKIGLRKKSSYVRKPKNGPVNRKKRVEGWNERITRILEMPWTFLIGAELTIVQSQLLKTEIKCYYNSPHDHEVTTSPSTTRGSESYNTGRTPARHRRASPPGAAAPPGSRGRRPPGNSTRRTPAESHPSESDPPSCAAPALTSEPASAASPRRRRGTSRRSPAAPSA
ncbi:DNA-directed RNA polymerase subunit beta'' [Striga asiatica]|uniref:DNA-directed RNA polymerase subunit beta n=1 Tax=Striga asiatica TaxID=4170 RepID=A0A5A7R5N0_STRAF|nr:DNA-directed RNA polymerase subunit beta'' [Striga asiatica]